MIRSCRIPPVLNRICDEQIPTALLVTLDGELLGTSNIYPHVKDPESFGTLLADIAVDYKRLGEEYASAATTEQRPRSSSSSHLQCLLIQFDGGLAGAAACESADCLVLAMAKPDTPPGLLKARLQSLADHVQESMSLLMEST